MAPTLTPRTSCLLLAIASIAILASVFAFQYLGGAAPCQMCIWQRYPYALLIALGLLGWFWQPRLVLGIGTLVLLVGGGIASYHYGVEQGWFALPDGCAAGGDATSVEELRRMLSEAPPACDQVQFNVFGWSLAAWNVLTSVVLATLTAVATVKG
jgi:disulfide bond formation protein DsbB